MNPPRIRFAALLATLVFASLSAHWAIAHDVTRLVALKKKLASLRAEAERSVKLTEDDPHCRLTLKLRDAETRQPIPAMVRITKLDTGQPLALPELILRGQHWHSATATFTIKAPREKIRIEAVRGVETKLTSLEVDLRDRDSHQAVVDIRKFYDARKRGWRNGNTHLHLMKLTIREADRYLREVPKSDDLDLVFLSHLRRIPDETTYISNMIVENSLPGGDLARLSKSGVLFRPGEEHRHNFGRGGEGYGHVMLLDIAKLIRPVSIGPGIMATGTDGIPLQRGIREARRDGATIIWCHNTFGFEDVPNWMAGLIDAQNIFDGGNQGSYEESFYRYLNLGLRVPFSTGTDWFIDDFSRVYAPLDGELTSAAWLQQMRAGRTFITNGPMLELTVNGRAIGDTIILDAPGEIAIQGRGESRIDFGELQLVHNGKVVDQQETQRANGVHTASIKQRLQVSEPGWIAIRTPLSKTQNELGNQLYSHTSPIYLELGGRRIFNPKIAQELIQETEANVKTIEAKGVYANDEERQRVLEVYHRGIAELKKRIREAHSPEHKTPSP